MKHYPKQAKSWYDLDFRLFNSKLARLQHRCCCQSGAQLPGCCSHTGSMLWLIYWSIFSGLGNAIKMSPRDLSIRKHLINLTAFCGEQKKMKDKAERWCPKCHTLLSPDAKFINCDSCLQWYHIHCVQMTTEEYQLQQTRPIWHCEACISWDTFVIRNT